MIFRIMHIDITINENKMIDIINAQHSNMLSTIKVNTGTFLTKSGKTFFKLKFHNEHGDYAKIAAIKEGANIKFCDKKISGYSGGFYEYGFNDYGNCKSDTENPLIFLNNILMDFAEKTNGTVVLFCDHAPSVVIRGADKSSEVDIGIVDKKSGRLYVESKELTGYSFDDEPDDFHINTPIFEWINNYPKLKDAVAKLPSQNEQADLIGKFLIKLREMDDITVPDFIDIFRQAGIIGFQNEDLKLIHKLIM